MAQHAQFEELCVLAASGQIAQSELSTLKEHLESCAECQCFLGDIGVLVGQILPELASERKAPPLPKGATERFIARAHSEGIPLTPKNERSPHVKWLPPHSVRVAAAFIVFALVALLASRGKILKGWQNQQPPQGVREIALNAASAKSQIDSDSHHEKLREQLDAVQGQLTGLESDLASREKALQSAQAENVRLSAFLADLQKENASLHQNLTERDAQIAEHSADTHRVQADLAKVQSANSADEFVIQADKSELENLRSKVASLSDQLQQSQQLSAGANQAKELIVARNLHIVDVDDTDGSGKRKQPFGRIFFTEGQSLVFYAYDLKDPRKLNAKINFYVWGSREGLNRPARNLGVFLSDDEKAGRWVLRIDDPLALADLNCVFVTAEPDKKPVTQPTGKQILFASLGGRANHP